MHSLWIRMTIKYVKTPTRSATKEDYSLPVGPPIEF